MRHDGLRLLSCASATNPTSAIACHSRPTLSSSLCLSDRRSISQCVTWQNNITEVLHLPKAMLCQNYSRHGPLPCKHPATIKRRFIHIRSLWKRLKQSSSCLSDCVPLRTTNTNEQWILFNYSVSLSIAKRLFLKREWTPSRIAAWLHHQMTEVSI